MNQWYISKGGKLKGPFTLEQMQDLVKTGELKPTDLVCPQGGAPKQASKVWGLFPTPSPAKVAPRSKPARYRGGFHRRPPPNRRYPSPCPRRRELNFSNEHLHRTNSRQPRRLSHFQTSPTLAPLRRHCVAAGCCPSPSCLLCAAPSAERRQR